MIHLFVFIVVCPPFYFIWSFKLLQLFLKVTPISQPVILVGGGAVLVDVQRPVSGASVVVKPAHFEVC